ncbi:hypothetical protein BGX38DRAFT_349973 [Terfezia claveryi]|nr:hypothetical protein BGX38DRAFT_349973 [Terfezia claveryi]
MDYKSKPTNDQTVAPSQIFHQVKLISHISRRIWIPVRLPVAYWKSLKIRLCPKVVSLRSCNVWGETTSRWETLGMKARLTAHVSHPGCKDGILWCLSRDPEEISSERKIWLLRRRGSLLPVFLLEGTLSGNSNSFNCTRITRTRWCEPRQDWADLFNQTGSIILSATLCLFLCQTNKG